MVSDDAADGLGGIKAQPVYRVLRCVFDGTALRVGDSGFLRLGRGVRKGTGPGQSIGQAGLPPMLDGRIVYRDRRSGSESQRRLAVRGPCARLLRG